MGLLSRARSAPLHIVLDWQRDPVPLPIQPNHTGPYPRLSVDHFRRQSEIANSIIGRAVVLDTLIEIPGSGGRLGISRGLSTESLRGPMPWLQSLRLISNSPNDPPEHGTTHDFFLFSQTTPRLRHVDFISFHPAWSDPIYSHLTYIKITSPYLRCDIKTLRKILQRCPLLTDLHLHHIFVDNDASPLSVAFLPALKACVIHDRHALSITTFIGCFRAPQLSHLIVTTVDYPMMNHLSVIDVPLIDFREITEVELSSEFWFSVITKIRLRTPNGFITHQVNYGLISGFTFPAWEVQQGDLLQWITTAPLPFAKVATLKISPKMSRNSMEQLFVLFPHIKTLALYGNPVRQDHYNLNTHSNFNLLDMPGTSYCKRLTEMRISVDPQYSFSDLSDFLSARASGVGGCRRLEVLVVFSATRPGTALHTLMASNVGKLVWKQARPVQSCDPHRMTLPDVDETGDEADQLYVDPSNLYFDFPA